MANLTLEQKRYIIAKEKGWSIRRLAKKIVISRSTVFKIKKDESRKVQSQEELILVVAKWQLRNKIKLFQMFYEKFV